MKQKKYSIHKINVSKTRFSVIPVSQFKSICILFQRPSLSNPIQF